MTPDDSLQPDARQWKKAIPEARDRLQSKILVWMAVPFLGYLSYWMAQDIAGPGGERLVYLRTALPISLFFALAAWRLRAATPWAAVFGGVICLQITIFSGRLNGGSVFHSGLTPLILLFILTREATKLGKRRRSEPADDEERQGRNAAQILANLGGAAVASSYAFYVFGTHISQSFKWPYIFASFQVPMLAALAEATADTVSSEIGQAFGGIPFLIPSFRRVPPGTDGAISDAGTAAGILAAAAIAFVGMPALGLSGFECAAVLFAATFGLFFDSFLGATIESRGWLGNDWVNLSSTVFAALISFPLQYYVWAIPSWIDHCFHASS